MHRFPYKTFLAVYLFSCGIPPSVVGTTQGEQRLYTGTQLAEARKSLQDYTFRDQKIGEPFAVNNETVIGVLLEMIRQDGGLKEIKVNANNRGQRELTLIGILDKNHPDFRALVEKLKL